MSQTLRISLSLFATTLTLLFGATFALTTPAHAAGVCDTYRAGIAIPDNYGAAYNVYNTSQMLLTVFCNNDDSVVVTTGKTDGYLTYVYKDGYYYANGAWHLYTYSCTGMLGGAWCPGKVTKTLTGFNTTGFIFLASYNCQWNGSKWNCGCRNTTCATGYWQLQAWESTVPTPTPTPGSGIQKYGGNPWYWQYKEQPVLLLGGSIQNALFHVSNLASHLDEIKAAGGNYLRVTMTQRKNWNIDSVGIARPYAQNSVGKFDLNQWNTDYWNKFENMLKLANNRDMIVQLELWDRWGFREQSWLDNAFNPANNINYTSAQSGLAEVVPKLYNPDWVFLPFYNTVPALDNNTLVLGYQKAFVRKVLSYTFKYPNVLYTVGNESINYEEWSEYWVNFTKSEASSVGISIDMSEMWSDSDLQSVQHHYSYNNPQIYSYLDLSQNSHDSNDAHWNDLQFARNTVSSNPRPMNHDKTYGSDLSSHQTKENALEVFWRNIIGGAASVRFHRPPGGLGISQPAKNAIASARKIETKVKFWELTPQQNLLSSRGSDEAYLAAQAGQKYVLYFTKGGSVGLNLSAYSGASFTVDWVNVLTGGWGSSATISGGSTVTINAPGSGPWVAAIVRR